MAAINLIPNVSVIVGQGLVFGAAIYVVNSLIVKPYRELREKRDSLTTGSQSEAKSMLKEIDDKTAEIKESRSKALSEASAVRNEAREKASSSANGIITEAKSKAEAEMAKVRDEFSGNLSAELGKVPTVVNQISGEIFDAAVK